MGAKGLKNFWEQNVFYEDLFWELVLSNLFRNPTNKYPRNSQQNPKNLAFSHCFVHENVFFIFTRKLFSRTERTRRGMSPFNLRWWSPIQDGATCVISELIKNIPVAVEMGPAGKNICDWLLSFDYGGGEAAPPTVWVSKGKWVRESETVRASEWVEWHSLKNDLGKTRVEPRSGAPK